MSKSVLDRRIAGRLQLEHGAYALLFVGALLFCTYGLGAPALRDDEALHALQARRIVRDGVAVYRYEPAYQGPALYYASAAVMSLAGTNDFAARLAAALAGLGVLAFAWPLRRYLGRWGALCFLAVLALSPTWVHFTRQIRHEAFLSLFALCTVYFGFRYSERRQPGFIYAAAASLALTLCGGRVALPFVLGAAVSWVGMRLWERGAASDVALARQPAEVETTDPKRTSWLAWATAGMVFLAVWTILYTSFGANPRYADLRTDPLGPLRPLRDTFTAWPAATAQPAWYYLALAFRYEPLILFATLACIITMVAARGRRDRFTRFCAIWAPSSLALYALTPEKLPWLLVPQLLPLALLAGGWLGNLIARGGLARPALAAPTAALAAFTLWTLATTLDARTPPADLEAAAPGYPSGPAASPPANTFGTRGTGRGEFNEPRDLDLDAAGNIYVVDSKNHRVQKFNPAGDVLRVWGSEGSGTGQFKEPCGLAVSSDDAVYVADTWNHRIQKFDADGNFVLEWGAHDPPLWGPRGIAVAGDGTVFVTDTGNKRVLAFTAGGELLRSWGVEGSQPGEFVEPVGITVDDDGDVIVADTGNHRLQFFRPEGTFVEEWPVSGWEEFYTEPYVVAAGRVVYVTDSHNHRFARYSGGKLDGTWGQSGSGTGELSRPIGIAAAGPGVVYVSDTLNHRVQRFVLGDQGR